MGNKTIQDIITDIDTILASKDTTEKDNRLVDYFREYPAHAFRYFEYQNLMIEKKMINLHLIILGLSRVISEYREKEREGGDKK